MIFSESNSNSLAAAVEHLRHDDLLAHILVPVDFSACADAAVRFAVAIALRTGAKINLFHSVQLPLPSTELVAYPIAEMERDAARKLGDIAAEITLWLEKERLRSVVVQYFVHIGFASEEIIRAATQRETDLIVMGTNGAGWLDGALLGSNATMVLQRVTCPVLLVPHDAQFSGFGKIVYATDMKEVNRPAIKVLADFASHFDAEIHVLHVLGHGELINQADSDTFKDLFDKAAHYQNVSFHIIDAEDDSLVHAVDRFVDAQKIDMLAMLTHHRTILGKLFNPSQTKKFALHTKVPLLAFH